MADIQTKSDWIESAKATLPKLHDYAAENGCDWDRQKAADFLAVEDYHSLAGMFEDLWIRLPDRGSIRFGPFFDLCDLCSERWALD